ncbi:hypothetical protein AVEN_125325-1 [Araneus ventricosus]|uniref:Uncharacterized protein n=1 Tax=Araneus ventricosus TaxID=182803 RepID=A0A4Y2S6I8_ARAVE|nr:hypothetical protein AVEN_125325-1 [Araneus ventricosus]
MHPHIRFASDDSLEITVAISDQLDVEPIEMLAVVSRSDKISLVDNCRQLGWGLGQWHKRASRLGESRIYSEAFQDALLWKFHSLLAGMHGTKPCGSQLPSAGDFNRNAWRHQQALQ